MNNPTPKEIKDARILAGHSQTVASATIYKKLRTWQQWEAGERAMDAAYFELYKIKTRQNCNKPCVVKNNE
jgi:DNA-binding transcriptional regulator YiaG